MREGICKEARIALGAVAPVPTRAISAEEYLKNKELTEEAAQAAADMAIETARPMSMNAYKVQITRKLVTQAIKAY